MNNATNLPERPSAPNDAPFKTSFFSEDRALPLVVEPGGQAVDLIDWTKANRDVLDRWLHQFGAVLFRGFPLDDVAVFQTFLAAASDNLLDYKERSSPRTAVGSKVYTSTDYPPSQDIFLHNENSYQQVWPMRLFFYCCIEPEAGGETPIADCRRIYARIRPDIRDKFAEKGIMYLRNFDKWSSVPWQTVFQTDDKSLVETHCKEKGLRIEWRGDDALRTRAVRPLVDKHPATGESTWFNHAAFFHISTLPALLREAILDEYDEEDLPTNSYYGDGSPIEPETLDHLREIYLDEKVLFPWRQGDALIVDNMLAAHGREPFKGKRKILVSMADPMTAP